MWLTDAFLVTFFGRWRGAVRIHVSHVQLTYTVINVQCDGGIHMWELLMCGRDIHLWELLKCGRGTHVWELLTCKTSHQSEILHSLIFWYVNHMRLTD